MNEVTEIDGQFSKLYEFFFKSHPTPIYVWKYCEKDFILIKYNNAADILTKSKMKDFLGKKASELYKDRPEIIEDLYRCNRNKTSFSKELKYYYQTLNEEKILNVNYYFIQPELILVHIEDITERKNAEEKLRENEQFLQNVFDAIRDGISVLDRELNIVRVNRWVEEMYKDSIPLSGKKCYEVYQKRLTICPWCPSEKAFETGEIQSEVVPYPSVDNPTGWIDLSAFPLKDENRNVVNIIEYVKNITIQKKAEQLLKESEEKYRSLMDGLSCVEIGIDVVSNDYKVLFQNQILINRFGDISGKCCYEKYMELKNPCEFCPMIKAIKNNRIETAELIGADGRNYELLSAPFPNPDGTIEKAVEVIIDITERKRIEQTLKKSEEKYREAYNRSNLYKDLFTHDINNILQNILSTIELFSLRLKNKEVSQQFDEIMNLIKEQITRGTKLVKNVQKLSEIEDTKKPIISIDLCETLKKSIAFLKSSFHYKNLDVIVKTTQSKLFVKGNDLLPNIFENILFNAVKHNLNEKIEIIIKISKVKKEKTDFIKLEFIDNGIGIPDVLKKELFSKKLREIEKEKITSGMGLGLILVKSILNSINGEITVEDRIEGDYIKGSNFIILILEAK